MSNARYIDPKHLKWFNATMDDIAKLTNRSLTEVVKQQAGLFARDLMRLTPPFGKSPLKESYGDQRKIGNAAVSHDVSLVFKPLDGYGLLRGDWNTKHGDIGNQVRKAVAKKNFALAEFLLNRVDLKPLAVIDRATVELHRQKAGRALRISGRSYRVARKQSIEAVKRQLQKEVGEAKAGWMRSLEMFGRPDEAPSWVRRHRSAGGAYETKSDTKPIVTIFNAVKYVQDRAPEIIPIATRVRRWAATKQLEHLQSALRKSAKKLPGVKVA